MTDRFLHFKCPFGAERPPGHRAPAITLPGSVKHRALPRGRECGGVNSFLPLSLPGWGGTQTGPGWCRDEGRSPAPLTCLTSVHGPSPLCLWENEPLSAVATMELRPEGQVRGGCRRPGRQKCRLGLSREAAVRRTGSEMGSTSRKGGRTRWGVPSRGREV